MLFTGPIVRKGHEEVFEADRKLYTFDVSRMSDWLVMVRQTG
jgi:hypothetical protein